MKRKNTNPTWTQGGAPASSGVEETAFDKFLRRNAIALADAAGSPKVQAWVKQNFKQRYVPEALLLAFKCDTSHIGASMKEIHERGTFKGAGADW